MAAPKPPPARAWVETILMMPDTMDGQLFPPPIGDGWQGGPWELVGVSMGPRQFPDDPHSPVWFSISWRRK